MFIIELSNCCDPMFVTGYNNTYAVPDVTEVRASAKRFCEEEAKQFKKLYLQGWVCNVVLV
jgi:hypothetical protein